MALWKKIVIGWIGLSVLAAIIGSGDDDAVVVAGGDHPPIVITRPDRVIHREMA